MTMSERKRKALVTVTIVFSVIYMVWRIFFTLPFQYGTVPAVCGVILLAVEIMGFFEMVVHFSQLSSHKMPRRGRADPADYPDVDVFISTYNEPVELLYKTVNGCQHMDYPDKSKIHIYLCDDGRREMMRKLAHHMGVYYLMRDTHKDAKAGNLNFALSQSHSPYIVTFDADMIPRHDFLTANIPYFLGEETIGFLQIPQTFYNPDLFQYNLYSEGRFPNEQDYFYRNVQIMRNASNTVIYGGTNTIISRQALDDIGGFVTGVVTEDFATGMKIESKGYQCYAIDEPHASGLAPEDLRSLVKQRQRWARGCIQTGRKLHLLFVRGLSFRQKISYISSITYWYSPVKRLVYILSPILYATFGVIVVKCTVLQVAIFWLPMYLLDQITLKKLSGNIRNTRLTNVYETIMVPGLLLPVLLESVGISQKQFVVTKKTGGAEPSNDTRGYRLRSSLLLGALYVLTVYGMFRCVFDTFRQGALMYVVILFWLLANFYNLTMALFFIWGRRHHRNYERFRARIDCAVSCGDLLVRAKTEDISEKGVSVALDFPEYIPGDRDVTIELAQGGYHAKWRGRVANVRHHNHHWIYGFAMTFIEEEDRRQLLQIVYDRNPSLPTEIRRGADSTEDIMVNLWHRADSRAPYYSRRLPRVEMEAAISTSAGSAVLRDFNYEYLTVRFLERKDRAVPHELTLRQEGVTIRCQLYDAKARLGACYRVENAAQLARNAQFRRMLRAWMTASRLDTQERRQRGRRLSRALIRHEGLNEMDYL